MSHTKEFPDFGPLPPEVQTLVDSGKLVDTSWRQDVCPSFVRAEHRRAFENDEPCVRFWVDYADPKKRELSEEGVKRYGVTQSPEYQSTLNTDDVHVALEHLFQWPNNGWDLPET